MEKRPLSLAGVKELIDTEIAGKIKPGINLNTLKGGKHGLKHAVMEYENEFSDLINRGLFTHATEGERKGLRYLPNFINWWINKHRDWIAYAITLSNKDAKKEDLIAKILLYLEDYRDLRNDHDAIINTLNFELAVERQKATILAALFGVTFDDAKLTENANNGIFFLPTDNPRKWIEDNGGVSFVSTIDINRIQPEDARQLAMVVKNLVLAELKNTN